MESYIDSNFLLSAIALLLGWLLRFAVTKYLRKWAQKKRVDKRYLINQLKNFINLLLVITLFMIWNHELQRFALSIAAFVVAIVLATKEIIQCVIGFVYLSSTNPYRVGDWIQVDGFVGELSETDWAKVTLLEIDLSNYSYTGRSLFIPNSQLMIHPIKNLNYIKRYANHSFSIVKEHGGFNAFQFKEALLLKAKEYCSNFNDVAERYNALIENRLGIKISGPEPSLIIGTSDIGKVKLSFSIFCPTAQAKLIEQKLVEEVFALWQKDGEEKKHKDT